MNSKKFAHTAVSISWPHRCRLPAPHRAAASDSRWACTAPSTLLGPAAREVRGWPLATKALPLLGMSDSNACCCSSRLGQVLFLDHLINRVVEENREDGMGPCGKANHEASWECGVRSLRGSRVINFREVFISNRSSRVICLQADRGVQIVFDHACNGFPPAACLMELGCRGSVCTGCATPSPPCSSPQMCPCSVSVTNSGTRSRRSR